MHTFYTYPYSKYGFDNESFDSILLDDKIFFLSILLQLFTEENVERKVLKSWRNRSCQYKNINGLDIEKIIIIDALHKHTTRAHACNFSIRQTFEI